MAKAKTKKEKDVGEKPIVLQNTRGEDMNPADYFYPYTEDQTDPKTEAVIEGGYKKGDIAIPTKFFNQSCGYPVGNEDLIEVFDEIFKPEDGFLFYKSEGKELYVIIIPISFTTTIGLQYNSQPGDFQKHAISFIMDGSVNVDTLRVKLKRVAASLNYTNK